MDLTELVCKPETVADLPVSEIPAILMRLASLQGVLLSRLAAGSSQSPRDVDGEGSADRNLSVREAAERLGMKSGYLYRHAKSLPFALKIGRRLLFSASGLERWNRRQQAKKS